MPKFRLPFAAFAVLFASAPASLPAAELGARAIEIEKSVLSHA